MAKTFAVLAGVRKLTAATAKTLNAELAQIEAEKQRLTADLDEAAAQIRGTLEKLGYGSNGVSVSKSPKASEANVASGKPRKRIRRTPEQLKGEAIAIIELIKSKGSEGATGPEIRARHAKIDPDLKGFVQKFGGKKLKTAGKARSMRYFVG